MTPHPSRGSPKGSQSQLPAGVIEERVRSASRIGPALNSEDQYQVLIVQSRRKLQDNNLQTCIEFQVRQQIENAFLAQVILLAIHSQE